MIEFKDFVPEPRERIGLTVRVEYEPFEDAVARASDWCSQPGIDIVNIETVVLPSIHDGYPRKDGASHGSTDPSLGGGSWHQFVRVWYTTE